VTDETFPSLPAFQAPSSPFPPTKPDAGAGGRASAVPANCPAAFEVKWTTTGVAGILEEVADKEPS